MGIVFSESTFENEKTFENVWVANWRIYAECEIRFEHAEYTRKPNLRLSPFSVHPHLLMQIVLNYAGWKFKMQTLGWNCNRNAADNWVGRTQNDALP